MSETDMPKMLRMLHHVGKVVNSLDDSQEVIDLLVEVVTETMNVDRCSIMLIDPHSRALAIRASRGLDAGVVHDCRIKVGEGIAGWVAAHGEPLLIKDVDKDPMFNSRRSASASNYVTKSLLSVPLISREQTAGVINVNNKRDGKNFNETDKAALIVVAGFVAIALDKAKMHQIAQQKEQLDAEVEAARRIQEMICPAGIPSFKNIDVEATNLPAGVVAGDFYDVTSAPDGKVWVVIGDVCGKGLAASLYMAAVVSYFRALYRYHDSPSGLVSAVNQLLSGEGTETIFVTACLLMFEERGKTVTLTTAGHPEALFRPAGRDEIHALSSDKGPPLGIDGEAIFSELSKPFLPGDQLLLYTDGVTEAAGESGGFFGTERLRSVMGQHRGGSGELLQDVLHAVYEFAGSQALRDDLTLVAIREPAAVITSPEAHDSTGRPRGDRHAARRGDGCLPLLRGRRAGQGSGLPPRASRRR